MPLIILAVNEYIELNRRHWDEATPLHVASPLYGVAAFKVGTDNLTSIELNEVGEVRGKTLLHLQCHFGLDTLSWARRGAIVTGVDFARNSIETARGLTAELGLDARFIESNVYDLPTQLSEQFDIVFASYGVLCWIPDVRTWAEVAAGYVQPGGNFYLLDGHPLYSTLWDSQADDLRLRHDYFDVGAIVSSAEGTYATAAKLENDTIAEFNHTLGDVVTALIDAGLVIEFLHEFPAAGYRALEGMVHDDDGFWRLPAGQPSVPFLFSVKARKPA